MSAIRSIILNYNLMHLLAHHHRDINTYFVHILIIGTNNIAKDKYFNICCYIVIYSGKQLMYQQRSLRLHFLHNYITYLIFLNSIQLLTYNLNLRNSSSLYKFGIHGSCFSILHFIRVIDHSYDTSHTTLYYLLLAGFLRGFLNTFKRFYCWKHSLLAANIMQIY